MPVGSSDGKYYESDLHWAAGEGIDVSQKAPVGHTEPRTDVLQGPEVSTYQPPDLNSSTGGLRETIREGAKAVQEATGIGKESFVKDFLTKFSNSKQYLDQYFEGKVDHNDPNLINAVTTLASTAGGVGLASAPLRTSSVGTFGGMQGAARTSAKNMPEGVEASLMTLKRLELSGIPEKDITYLTGWWKGHEDKKWRFEIPDKNANLDTAYLKQVEGHGAKTPEGNAMVKLGDLLEHEDLYKVYPSLQNYNVIYQRDGIEGVSTAIAAFAEREKTLLLGPAFMKMPKEEQVSTLLHEIQHGLQAIEGFGRGGNKNMTESGLKASELDSLLEKASDKVRQLREIKDPTPEQKKEIAAANAFLDKSVTYYAKLRELQDNAFQEYLQLPGEKESREVQRLYEKSIGYKQNEEDWIIDNIDDSFWK